MVALKRVVIIIFHLIILLSWLTAAYMEDNTIIANVSRKEIKINMGSIEGFIVYHKLKTWV